MNDDVTIDGSIVRWIASIHHLNVDTSMVPSMHKHRSSIIDDCGSTKEQTGKWGIGSQ
jgi:hypothetical protein